MNKEEYNKLGIIDQMTYMNKLLETMSLTKACESINIDRATVRKRFKSNEISFSKEFNKYVFDVPYEKHGVEAIRKKESLDNTTNETTITTDESIKLTKKEFSSMDLETKVNTVNKLLETHTIDQLTEHTKVKFINLFRDLGYTYKQGNPNRFIKSNEKLQEQQINNITTETTTTTDKEIIESKTKKLVKLKKKMEDFNTEQELKDKQRLLEVEKKVSTLEVQMKNLLSTLDTKTTTNTITTNILEPSNIRVFDGDEVVRSFRVNADVQKRFKNYCKSHSDNKVSDILSTILDEYLKSQDF